MGVCRLYPLVIVLFRFDDLKTKLLVEVDRRLVTDLNVKVNVVKSAILLTDVQHVVQHLCSNAQSAVGCEAAQCHDVQSLLVLGVIHPTAHGSHGDVIEVR